MDDERDPIRRSDYRAARIGAASALTATLIVLLILDAISPTYDVQPPTLYGILGAILMLLGLEGLSIIRGGK